jgi:hypothetical protein
VMERASFSLGRQPQARRRTLTQKNFDPENPHPLPDVGFRVGKQSDDKEPQTLVCVCVCVVMFMHVHVCMHVCVCVCVLARV